MTDLIIYLRLLVTITIMALLLKHGNMHKVMQV